MNPKYTTLVYKIKGFYNNQTISQNLNFHRRTNKNYGVKTTFKNLIHLV